MGPHEQVVIPPLTVFDDGAIGIRVDETARMLDDAGYMPVRAYDRIDELDHVVSSRVDRLEVDLEGLKGQLMEQLLREAAEKLRKLAVENDISAMSDDDFEIALQKLLFER